MPQAHHWLRITHYELRINKLLSKDRGLRYGQEKDELKSLSEIEPGFGDFDDKTKN